MNPFPVGGPVPPLPASGLATLTELSLDLHWSWNHLADGLWRQIDPAVWAATRHPCAVLQSASQETLACVLVDPEFCRLLHHTMQARREAEAAPLWFQQQHPKSPLNGIAYFCMEFMLSEALPIYSGGLGNVAGDQLKAASDLGVPVFGVGLLYQHGYFRQVIDAEGVQQALHPYNDPAQLPVTPVRRADGECLHLTIDLPGHSVVLRTWEVRVGRTRLYLLDSNDAANFPPLRAITGELYGGDREVRLQQEVVLGIGGWRLLTALGLQPDVCHLNEGHAAFALLERARNFMRVTGQPFAVALAATRAGNLFTTHTAVAAGFDRFSPALIELYLGRYAEEELGIPSRELLALGRQNPDDADEPFNLAYLALRGSGTANGVSRLHGEVSRRIFAPLFPGWPEHEIPIGHVTNGVHMPTWDSAAADALWTEACGQNRWRAMSPTLEADFRRVSDEKLWALRASGRRALVDYACERVGQQLRAAGVAPDLIARNQARLNHGVLTLGFARRFVTYKRPHLLLHDPDRLIRILTNPQRPVQLILAGKAHPADVAGQTLIQEWARFIQHHAASLPVVFLADYDMHMAEMLVQGVDVWINTPRRPWEASGTSGMKVLVNGGLNLSELDGWWAEAYRPDLGWALGDGQEHGDDPARDAIAAGALYDRLEDEVMPLFYTRNAAGLPVAWVARIRESMARLTPRFSAARTVRDYTERHYLPAASAYRQRALDHGAATQKRLDGRRVLTREGAAIRFGTMTVETHGDHHVVTVEVFLNDVSPDSVRLELYADGLKGGRMVRQEMTRVLAPAADTGGQIYRGAVASARPMSDFTARILPQDDGGEVLLEAGWILWQK